METNTNVNIRLVELNSKELSKINGGGLMSAITAAAAKGSGWAIFALYIIEETIVNPKASYDAFMRGWNACK